MEKNCIVSYLYWTYFEVDFCSEVIIFINTEFIQVWINLKVQNQSLTSNVFKLMDILHLVSNMVFNIMILLYWRQDSCCQLALTPQWQSNSDGAEFLACIPPEFESSSSSDSEKYIRTISDKIRHQMLTIMSIKFFPF